MSAAVPNRRTILHLYSAMLRTSRSFSSYNFREYFIRQTKETFRSIQVRLYYTFYPEFKVFIAGKSETDPVKVRSMYSDAVREFTVLKRGAIVNQLYGGHRLAVETEHQPEEFKTRGDN